MKLTRVERWILSNQYKILWVLHPEEKDHYDNARDVLESGYELEYDWIAKNVYSDEHCLSTTDCSEVLDVLSMYDQLQRGYDALEDKSALEAHAVDFPGFDGNSESTRSLYCEHLAGSGKFKDLRHLKDWNSHMPMLEAYQRMVLAWKPLSLRDGQPLSAREILEILATQPHPDSEVGRLAAAKPQGPVQ